MQEISILLSNARIAGIEFGPADKPVILALHGWLDNAASFIPLAEHLTEYRIVALDLPGHGHSSHRSPDAHYHFVDYVQDLHEIVSVAGWKEFILLGHSMGGIVASVYSACFPERVSTHISIESFGPMTKGADTCVQQLRESICSRADLHAKKVSNPANLEAVINARAKAGALSYASAKLLMERNLAQQGETVVWRTDRRLRSISSVLLMEQQAEYFMRHIQSPMLTICGDKGFDATAEMLSQRQGFVQNLQVSTCKGGHHVHMDNPQQVALVIKQFLQG